MSSLMLLSTRLASYLSAALHHGQWYVSTDSLNLRALLRRPHDCGPLLDLKTMSAHCLSALFCDFLAA